MNVDEFLTAVQAGLDETDRTVTGLVTMTWEEYREHCLTQIGVARQDVQKYAKLNMPIEYRGALQLVRVLEESLRVARAMWLA